MLIYKYLTSFSRATFSFYELLRVSNRLKLIAGEQAIPIVNKTEFENYPVLLPPLPEQRKIAAILSAWDDAIAKTRKLISRLELQKKGLMQELLRPKEGMKSKWSSYTLGEIITRVERKNTFGNTNVVTISAQRGFVKQDDFFSKQVASKTLTNYYLLKKGEFAYNRSYSNGYPMGAFKKLDDFDFGVVTTLYICFSLNDGHDSDFFKHFFEQGGMNRELSQVVQEGARAHGLLNISLSDN